MTRVFRKAAIPQVPIKKAAAYEVLFENERRYDYIMALAEYTLTHGAPALDTALFDEDAAFDRFCSFCEQCRQRSLSLVEDAHALQRKRDKRKNRNDLR